ncbi:MAG TPA: cysteine hydrolase [Amycolatopsis sp.]|uniref:cysteine hydrolase family protein n=1 Tax=Amycolatopsis sp. TaxID=37632 RepID=UPI002B4A3DB7|nr:cysteine hydrolase [Amycolatopsis sp.]HKS46989.1 cysteine hydrolase [Amycolatopsis sp.]
MARSRHTLDPAQSALLVMDLQPFKLGPLPNSEDLLKRVAAAVETARDMSVQVAYVRAAYSNLDYATVPDTNRRLLPAIKERVLHVDAANSGIHESVAPQDGDIVERKTRVGSFITTRLDEELTNQGIINLILAGIYTSSTVLSTVRDAADRDYQLYLLADCVADPDAEVHEFLVRKVLSTQAKIITTDDLGGLIRPAPRRRTRAGH